MLLRGFSCTMKPFNSVSIFSYPNCRSCLYSLFITLSLICGAYFTGSIWPSKQYSFEFSKGFESKDLQQDHESAKCSLQDKCGPDGSKPLPKGIVSSTSNLEMRPLSGRLSDDDKIVRNKSLLAITVGIKQNKLVAEIVNKFLADDFAVMLFHYDGVVDQWNNYEWYSRVLHVSAANQTKWWFAKRFLHPAIVAEYDYIFLWDEDLSVDNFHPKRYVGIVREEGLEISQPALDSDRSEVHHLITVRNRRSRVHRRYYRLKGNGPKCDHDSTNPPCVGWVEMMAPVFSKEAWHCVWHMVQSDLIHAWGLDMKLGYCAQGDRAVKVGVVDEEYIVHHGLPILGDVPNMDKAHSEHNSAVKRSAIRMRSFDEMKAFKQRWEKAVKEDSCWVDPYPR